MVAFCRSSINHHETIVQPSFIHLHSIAKGLIVSESCRLYSTRYQNCPLLINASRVFLLCFRAHHLTHHLTHNNILCVKKIQIVHRIINRIIEHFDN